MAELALISYAAAQGYLRAKLSRLLNRDSWERLLTSRSLGEFGQVLKETPTLATAVTRNGSVAQQVLRGELASAAFTVVRFLPDRPRQLVTWYNRCFEIENLKAILRKIHYHIEWPHGLIGLVPVRSLFKWDDLLGVRSVAELIDRLRASPYALPLEHAMERYNQEGRLFYLEIALDLFYFQRLVRLIEEQGGSDWKEATQFLGRAIATQNLLWAYRYRIHGHMLPEEIINFTLHRAFAAGLETVRRIALGSPLPVEAERLGFRLSPGRSDTEALVELQFLGEQERFRRAAASIRRPLFSLGGVLAYFSLAEAEIRDLSVLAEGKVAGLSAEQIGPRLLRAA
jgi:V/A-type H+/Na+-transporting ATPase subunit C